MAQLHYLRLFSFKYQLKQILKWIENQKKIILNFPQFIGIESDNKCYFKTKKNSSDLHQNITVIIRTGTVKVNVDLEKSFSKSSLFPLNKAEDSQELNISKLIDTYKNTLEKGIYIYYEDGKVMAKILSVI